METRGLRYFFGFILVIGLLIFLIVLLFGGGDSKDKVAKTAKTLSSYANSTSEVSMVHDGPINAASEHRKIVITVDQNRVLYEEQLGYDGNVTESKSFANTKNSYATFLRALENANFTKGETDKSFADERGYCPAGNRYIFGLKDAGKTIQRFWATSCGKPKSYLGQTSATIDLFQSQVPGYFDLSDDVEL